MDSLDEYVYPLPLRISGQIKRYGKRKIKLDANNPTQVIKRLDQDALDLRSLQILRGLIYNEECLLPENWESKILDSSIQDILKSIAFVQNCLNKLELSNRTQAHMVNTSDAVRREAITLQSTMLINANVNVQVKFFYCIYSIYFLSVQWPWFQEEHYVQNKNK